MTDSEKDRGGMRLALINDPAQWRSKAEQTRTLAEEITDADAKAIMFQIAEGYDRLAERAEARILTGDRKPTR